MNFLTIAFTRTPGKRAAPPPLPDVTRGEAASWFSGWWCGIAIGGVSGLAIGVLLAKIF